MEEEIHQIEALYRQYGLEILGYLGRHFPAAGAAEDLLQETFVQAVRNRDHLGQVVRPKGWLLGIARNVGLMALRRRRFVCELPAEVPERIPAVEDPRIEAMRKVINRLPENQRELLDFRLVQQLSYEEIAGILKIPVGTVRSRLHYTIHQLKEQLGIMEKEGS